jgi:light-regulated signal transduction histidine kinase (bacteriophytochrome)
MAVPNFWLEQIHPDDRARVLDEDRAALSDQAGQIETEYRLRRKDGAYRWFRSFVRLEYDETGRLVNLLGHRLDITPRKQAEHDLLERQVNLDAANRELEAFSYSVSHDLRAPLRSIDGFSLALLEEYNDRLDAAGRDYLHRVRAATQRMGALIDDLLNLSRVTRAPLRREEVRLSELADSITRQLQQSDPQREVEWKIQPGLVAVGDPGLLRVVLDNLLGNAWKFTVRRARARIEFGAYPRGPGRLVYFVRDNGAGFDQAYADKLFGAFQRLHAMQEFAGTGIGLATVARVVRRHGGRVWAEGEVEKGAAFYFTLHAEEPARTAEYSLEGSESQG